MGWRNNAFAKVWKVQDKGNYSVAKISISGRNKDKTGYETKFKCNFVKFVGQAHELSKQINTDNNGNVTERSGVTIKISGCDHETPEKKYPAGTPIPSSAIADWVDKDGNVWCRFANYVIFGFEFPDAPVSDNSTVKNAPKYEVPAPDEEELPF